MEKIAAIALITEALWETLKMVKTPKGINGDRIGAIVVGIVVAIAGRFDIFEAIGLPLSVNYVGYILTGLLISRGSNFIHDILGTVGGAYQIKKDSLKASRVK